MRIKKFDIYGLSGALDRTVGAQRGARWRSVGALRKIK